MKSFSFYSCLAIVLCSCNTPKTIIEKEPSFQSLCLIDESGSEISTIDTAIASKVRICINNLNGKRNDHLILTLSIFSSESKYPIFDTIEPFELKAGVLDTTFFTFPLKFKRTDKQIRFITKLKKENEESITVKSIVYNINQITEKEKAVRDSIRFIRSVFATAPEFYSYNSNNPKKGDSILMKIWIDKNNMFSLGKNLKILFKYRAIPTGAIRILWQGTKSMMTNAFPDTAFAIEDFVFKLNTNNITKLKLEVSIIPENWASDIFTDSFPIVSPMLITGKKIKRN